MRKFVAAIAAMLMLGVVFIPSASADMNAESSVSDQAIDALYERRALAVLDGDAHEVAVVEAEMRAAGIEFLTDAQVAEIQSRDGRSAVREQLGMSGGAQPMVAVPASSNVSWTSKRETITYKGTKYNVQTLTAQPKASGNGSILDQSGSVSEKRAKDVQAGVHALLKSVALSGASMLPLGGVSVSIYDAVSSTISSLKKTTIVKNVAANYTWKKAETAQFKYVRKSSQTDAYQALVHVSTQVSTSIVVNVPTLVTKQNNVLADIVVAKRNVLYTSSSYGSSNTAVSKYYGKDYPAYSWVPNLSYTTVSGSKFTIPTAQPRYPASIR